MTTYALSRWLVSAALISSTLIACVAQDGNTRKDVAEVPEREMAKRLVNVTPPPLPDKAIAKCSNALVMLKITIDETGAVSSEEYVSGYSELKDSSLAAVKQWTYKPYEKHGHAVSVQTRVSIFYLGDGESFPMFTPDGNGGVKGGNTLPMPPGCGGGISIKRTAGPHAERAAPRTRPLSQT